MRMIRVILLSLMLPFMAAPGISAGDGSGMRASNGGGSTAGGLDCKEADAFLNYDAQLVSGTDGVAETTWANSGTGGSSWDLNSAVGGGLVYEQAGDCTQSGGACLKNTGGTRRLRMSASVTKSWTHQLQCVVAYMPGTGIVRSAQVSIDVLSRNMFGSNGITDMRYVSQSDGIVTLGSNRDTLLVASCIDMTTSTSADFAVNGTLTDLGVDLTSGGSGYRDIEQIILGARNDGALACTDCEIHQYIAWDSDPGMTAAEMSSCLFSKWGSL